MNKKDKLIVIGKGYPKKNLFLTGGDMTYGAVGTAANAAADVLDKSFINKGAHNKVGDVLNTVSDIMPAWTPYTLLAKGILKTAGIVANGLTNSANEQQVKQKGLEIANFANQTSNATDYNQLQQDYDVLQHQNVDLGKIDDWGSAGFLSSGSKRKNAFNNAKTAYDTAFRMRKDGLSQRGQNINLNNTMLQMKNLSAFGGPLDMWDTSGAINYGFMSDWLTTKNKQAENKNNLGGGTIGTVSSMNGFAGGGPLFALGGPEDPPGTTIYREVFDPKNPKAGVIRTREFIPIQPKKVEPWEPVSNINKEYVPQHGGIYGHIPQGMTKEDGEYYQKILHDKVDYPITTYSYGYKKGAYQPYRDDYELMNVHNYPNGALGYDIRNAQGTTQYIPTKDGRWFRMVQGADEMGEPTGEYIDTLPAFDFNKYTLKSTDGKNYVGNPNFHALGGVLQTHGSDWSDGLVSINEGGTHEMNPNEGVQMGVDPEGVPNLVEEGETVFNDYVYSTRIPIDDITKERFHIGKKREMTYADLSKKLEKEVSERPNDPISQAAFKAQMAALAEEQERQKAEMEAARAREAFEALSPEEQTALMQQAAQQEQMAQEQAMQEQAMAEQAAAEQQPTPEEIAMAEQQQQMMQADGSEAALGQAPQMACGGKINRFDKGGKKNVGKWKDDKENHWDVFTKPGLRKYIENVRQKLKMAPDEETKNAIRRDAMNELNTLQQSYYDYVREGAANPTHGYSDDILKHQQMFDRLYGNTGFYTTDEKGNVRNLIAEAIDIPNGAATEDKPLDWTDGYNGPRTSIRNFGSTAYGDNNYYQDLVDEFADLGLSYAPNENWKYGENKLYGLSMAEPPAAEEGKAPQVWDWNAGNWVDKPQEQPAVENPGNNGNNGNVGAGTGDDREVVPIHRNERLREVGLMSPAIALSMQMANIGRPDTSGVTAAAERAWQPPVLASYRPIGEYLKYNPFNIDYAANQLRSTSAGNRRDILNSNASAGARNAMLLAQNFNDQNALGNLYRQAQEYNNQHRAQVSDFNRGTDQFNAQASTQTSQFNADAINRNRQYASQLAMQAAREKMDADAGWYQSIYGNIGALAKGIGDLGRENAQRNMIADMAANGIFGQMTPNTYIANGMLRYETDEERARRLARKKNSGAKGGKIKRKKGFTY